MIELKEAIEVARILAKAPQERLRMLLSVFEEAGLTLEGIEEMEAIAVAKDKNNVVDISELMEDLAERFSEMKRDGKYVIPIGDFAAYCEEKGFDARAVRPCLARRGILKTFDGEKGKGTQHTTTASVGGKKMRCVILEEAKDEEGKSVHRDDGQGV